MDYVTHKRDDGTYQSLRAHLQGVAERAEAFAGAFGAQEHARRIGMLHDIGKYSPAAQARQRDPEHVAKVDHASAGAQVAEKMYKDTCAAFTIAGHHGGLPDLGSKASTAEDGTMMGRIKKPLVGKLDYAAWKTEVEAPPTGNVFPQTWRTTDKKQLPFAQAMYTRMLFSCLVDADYLDTEAFMKQGSVQRGQQITMAELLERVQNHVTPWLAHPVGVINQARCDVLRTCLQGGAQEPGLYTLTIPTGGGKTVSSLAFALSHAVQHGMERVIYVVPYTSIIEQNAQVFREILGDEHVLEHHANVEIDPDDESPLRLATENWDAPVVVTTAVQFFESLYAARTSRCRKLHNIGRAVIVLDEAQMLPLPYLRPCVNALVELTRSYNSTVVLCTATQPSLNGLIREYAPDVTPQEIFPDTRRLQQVFRRTIFVMEGKTDPACLAERLSEKEQVLCIVNSRKHAQEIYHALPEAGRFHLSTLMTPEDRQRVLDEIRRCLKAGQCCRVISTSLVEAGVNLDFPSVWREMAGLDSILQAAGRCNREGKRPQAESRVHVFAFEKTPQVFRQNVSATEIALTRWDDPASSQAIRTYFDELLQIKGKEALDEKKILQACAQLNFRQVEREFKLIESETIPVYIPTAENASLLDALRAGSIDRAGLRKLGRSAVNVYPQHFDALRPWLECPADQAYGILLDEKQYSRKCGLALEPDYSTFLMI